MSEEALADPFGSAGKLHYYSDDGFFKAQLGGRIHLDNYENAVDGTPASGDDGVALRRIYVSLNGRLRPIRFRAVVDVKGPVDVKESWLATRLGDGTLYLGHLRPAFGMEMRTSSNDVLFAERQFISKDTLLTGRGYQNGVGYELHQNHFGLMTGMYVPNAAQDRDPVKGAMDGQAYSVRAYLAPLTTEHGLLHVGASFDRAQYDQPGDGRDVVANPVSRTGPAYTLLRSNEYDRQQTVTLEVGGRLGPLFMQGELARAAFGGPAGTQDMDACYIESSYFLTGESRPYNARLGVFRSPSSLSTRAGAVELKARYAMVANNDATGRPQVSSYTIGINYYHTPSLRLLLDYSVGNYSDTTASDEQPRAFVGRAQFVF